MDGMVGINLTIASDIQPSSISFTAFKRGTNEPILLDGEVILVIQPTTRLIERVVNIGMLLLTLCITKTQAIQKLNRIIGNDL